MMTTETAFCGIPAPMPVGSLAHRVRLRDGAVLDVRPIRPGDSERLQRFHARLSPASVLLRYFHVVPALPEAVIACFTHVDYVNRMTLVATAPGDVATAAREQESEPEWEWEMVGMVNCDRISAEAAEVAFVVADAWQGRGVAGILLCDLAAYARECGFRHLLAITLRCNLRMLNLLRHCGFPCTVHDGGDEEIEAWLDITAAPLCPISPVPAAVSTNASAPRP